MKKERDRDRDRDRDRVRVRVRDREFGRRRESGISRSKIDGMKNNFSVMKSDQRRHNEISQMVSWQLKITVRDFRDWDCQGPLARTAIRSYYIILYHTR